MATMFRQHSLNGSTNICNLCRGPGHHAKACPALNEFLKFKKSLPSPSKVPTSNVQASVMFSDDDYTEEEPDHGAYDFAYDQVEPLASAATSMVPPDEDPQAQHHWPGLSSCMVLLEAPALSEEHVPLTSAEVADHLQGLAARRMLPAYNLLRTLQSLLVRVTDVGAHFEQAHNLENPEYPEKVDFAVDNCSIASFQDLPGHLQAQLLLLEGKPQPATPFDLGSLRSTAQSRDYQLVFQPRVTLLRTWMDDRTHPHDSSGFRWQYESFLTAHPAINSCLETPQPTLDAAHELLGLLFQDSAPSNHGRRGSLLGHVLRGATHAFTQGHRMSLLLHQHAGGPSRLSSMGYLNVDTRSILEEDFRPLPAMPWFEWTRKGRHDAPVNPHPFLMAFMLQAGTDTHGLSPEDLEELRTTLLQWTPQAGIGAILSINRQLLPLFADRATLASLSTPQSVALAFGPRLRHLQPPLHNLQGWKLILVSSLEAQPFPAIIAEPELAKLLFIANLMDSLVHVDALQSYRDASDHSRAFIVFQGVSDQLNLPTDERLVAEGMPPRIRANMLLATLLLEFQQQYTSLGPNWFPMALAFILLARQRHALHAHPEVTAAGLVILPPEPPGLQAMAAGTQVHARGRRRHPQTFQSTSQPQPPLPLPTSAPAAAPVQPQFAFPNLPAHPYPASFLPEAISREWSPVMAANARLHPSPTYKPPAAPPAEQSFIDRTISAIGHTGRLAYFAPHLDPLTVAILVDKVRHCPPLSFLDGGANICVIDLGFLERLGLPCWATSLSLATSTSQGQQVFGITGPITLQFGSPTSGASASLTTVCVVTRGMHRLYDLLVSNQVLYDCGAVIDYRSQPVTVTLHFTAEGAPLTMPLGAAP